MNFHGTSRKGLDRRFSARNFAHLFTNVLYCAFRLSDTWRTRCSEPLMTSDLLTCRQTRPSRSGTCLALDARQKTLPPLHERPSLPCMRDSLIEGRETLPPQHERRSLPSMRDKHSSKQHTYFFIIWPLRSLMSLMSLWSASDDRLPAKAAVGDLWVWSLRSLRSLMALWFSFDDRVAQSNSLTVQQSNSLRSAVQQSAQRRPIARRALISIENTSHAHKFPRRGYTLYMLCIPYGEAGRIGRHLSIDINALRASSAVEYAESRRQQAASRTIEQSYKRHIIKQKPRRGDTLSSAGFSLPARGGLPLHKSHKDDALIPAISHSVPDGTVVGTVFAFSTNIPSLTGRWSRRCGDARRASLRCRQHCREINGSREARRASPQQPSNRLTVQPSKSLTVQPSNSLTVQKSKSQTI
jgi:hypothetical protein